MFKQVMKKIGVIFLALTLLILDLTLLYTYLELSTGTISSFNPCIIIIGHSIFLGSL